MIKKQIAKNQFSKQSSVLKNGLRIATDEMKEVETVSIGVFVNTGSRNEDVKINGISHFLEHMAFKGTPTRSAKKIAEEFEGIGGYINAYTSKEKTVYYVKVLKKYGEFAVEFLSDIIQNSIFDKSELEKERGVILQEIAMTNDTPDDIVFDYFHEQAFANQPLGRSILGSPANIKKFKRDDFVNYIKNQYNYSNIAIVGAGNLKHQDLVKWSEKYFNKLAKNNIIKPPKAKYLGGEYRKEKKLEQINMVLGFKGFSYADDNFYTGQILSMILGGGMSSRLFQEVRENLGLAYSIYSFNSCYYDCGLFAIYAGTTPNKANKMLETVKKELLKITKKINNQEMQRVITQFEAGLLMSKESTSSRMQKLGNDLLIFNRLINDEEMIEQLKDINLSKLTKLANDIFFGSKPTMAVIGETKKITQFSW